MSFSITHIRNYFSLVKFSHTIFALPFALIGFTLGITQTTFHFKWEQLVSILLCMVFARNTAMAFNRYADRKFDSLNERTQIREIPAQKIKPSEALVFTIINAVLFIGTTFFINQLCFYLSPVALLVIVGYSLTKRFTALCHLVLGVGLALAPIGAYMAVTNQFALLPILFSFTVLFWVSGFDIIYALQDEDFDKTHKLYSIPSMLGAKRALVVSRLLHVITTLTLLMIGVHGEMGMLYWLGAIIFISLLVYQHSIVKATDLSRVNIAFATTNGIASVIFGILVIINLLWQCCK